MRMVVAVGMLSVYALYARRNGYLVIVIIKQNAMLREEQQVIFENTYNNERDRNI